MLRNLFPNTKLGKLIQVKVNSRSSWFLFKNNYFFKLKSSFHIGICNKK